MAPHLGRDLGESSLASAAVARQILVEKTTRHPKIQKAHGHAAEATDESNQDTRGHNQMENFCLQAVDESEADLVAWKSLENFPQVHVRR